MAAVVIFVLGLWLGWQANGFVAEDVCLDHGGAWDEATRSCRLATVTSSERVAW